MWENIEVGMGEEGGNVNNGMGVGMERGDVKMDGNEVVLIGSDGILEGLRVSILMENWVYDRCFGDEGGGGVCRIE